MRHRSAQIAGLVLLLSLTINGLPDGAQTASASAPFGRYLALDGVDDYATAPDSASLDLGVAGASFTIEGSVYVPDTTSDASQIIFYKNSSSSYALRIQFHSSAP